MNRVWMSGIVAAALLAVAPRAFAQGSSATQQARRHMEAGQEFYLQERWPQAAEEFLAAYELRSHSAFLMNAAMAYHRHGAATLAVEVYRRYLDTSPDASDRADIEQRIEALEQAAAEAAARPVEPPDPVCEGPDCPEQPPCPEGQECPEPIIDPECPEGEDCNDPGQEPLPGEHVVIELDPSVLAPAERAVLRSVILVEVEPADATIALMDESGAELLRSGAPLEYTAEPGRYSLLLEHPEYRAVQTPVHVHAGRFYVFHIEMSQPPAFLQVTSNVPGSTVYLDDRSAGPVGQTPWGDVIRTGEHTLWIERPGYEPVERQIEIALGQEQEVTVDLERLPFGMVRVLSNVDDATVEIDGEQIGRVPLSHVLSPGDHSIVVGADGMKDYETTITIERGQTTRVLVRLNPRPSRTSAWISLSFSAAVFAASGVLGWYSTVLYRDMEDLARDGRLLTDDRRMTGGFLFALGADIGFAIGTITAALALYYFLRDPLPPSEGRVQDPVDFTENPEMPGPGLEMPGDSETAAQQEAYMLDERATSRRDRPLPVQVGFTVTGFQLRF